MTTLEIAKSELKPGWSLIAFQNNQLIGEWMPDLIPEWILAHSDVLRWEVNSCETEEEKRKRPRTLELSYNECAHLAAVLLNERAHLAAVLLNEREVLQIPVDGQPRRTGGVTGQNPHIDALIRKLHAVYPKHNWIKYL